MAVNVYQKLQKARVELQKQPLKESGRNTYAEYSYLELGNFLPQINAICAEIGICGVVTFGTEEASLTIVNCEQPEEKIIFNSPMSTANLKGCHPVQNLGATFSYLRRYLWLAAFEIVEHDALDSTTGKPEKTARQERTESQSQQQRQQNQQQKSGATDVITDAQVKMIFAKMKSKGLDPERLKEAFKVESSKQILKSQMNDILAWIDGEAQQPPQ